MPQNNNKNEPKNNFSTGFPKPDPAFLKAIRKGILNQSRQIQKNLDWLYAQMHPYFFITNKTEIEALVHLISNLHRIPGQRQFTISDQEKKYMVARLNIAGSLYDTLKSLQEREISYAELAHSYAALPGADHGLEIQKYEFDRKSNEAVQKTSITGIPHRVRQSVRKVMRVLYPDYDFRILSKDLGLLFVNNEDYVQNSPPERVARLLWLCRQCQSHDGLFLEVEETEDVNGYGESRLLFSVENPHETGLMTQISEIFQRLDVRVLRFYMLNMTTGAHRYFLGTFYVSLPDHSPIQKDSDLFRGLKAELYNIQILSTARTTYKKFVANRMMTGIEASLANTFVAFCHTTLAHNQPDRFNLEAVKSAIVSNTDMTMKLVRAFKMKFDPEQEGIKTDHEKVLFELEASLHEYNTGHRYLDEIRKTIFHTCLLFIRYTLKTNFFVLEKHALSFRLDPQYLNKIDAAFISDLPKEKPFRVTFFFSRHGVGYHIGFSDIARGGWRTVICGTQDEYTTNSNTLFREVFVLAHTQHLKNKDIYEGGSKMTVVLNTEDLRSKAGIAQRLHKVQYGFLNAFLDIFVTENGKVLHPRVMDYYQEDEPIELGPDENMHDDMVEYIAAQAKKRKYLLGIGLISSKYVGINHKDYGVTSRGVIKFSEIAMKALGIDIAKDPFSVKITGGPNGDVAGNAMKLLLARCPLVKLKSIVAGAGALYDPEGVSTYELAQLVLKKDIVDFPPGALNPGGYILYRRERKQDGMRELFKRIVKTSSGLDEHWVTLDEFQRDFDHLIFNTPADLFLPCGGRPETIDADSVKRFMDKDQQLSAKVIVEGANSYIKPDARDFLQKHGVVLLRDASANKCGVISSSYEIIANLLMTENEFLKNKDAYVKGVLEILDKRVEQEAGLIFRRHGENRKMLYTDISDHISREINGHYKKLFNFFQEHCSLCEEPLYTKVILSHLPAFIREKSKYRKRVNQLPQKIKYAILASEISTAIVYEGGWVIDFQSSLRDYVNQKFA